MHSRFRLKGVTMAVLAALVALLVVPGALLAEPKPGNPARGFRLMARATGAMTVNRVYCGLLALGNVCVDSLGSTTRGGGYWPKGSPQQYVFNSGLQAVGSVDPAAGFPILAKRNGAKLAILNREPTDLDPHADLVLHDEIGPALSEIIA